MGTFPNKCQNESSLASCVFLGRREDSSGPPRGIVKNLRGRFENPQSVEARTG